jgi:hypothetical protein
MREHADALDRAGILPVQCEYCRKKIPAKNMDRHLRQFHKSEYKAVKSAAKGPQTNSATTISVSGRSKKVASALTKTNARLNEFNDLMSGYEDILVAFPSISYGIKKFLVNGDVPLSRCQYLIKETAYWYSHPCGHAVQAPKDYNRIVSTKKNNAKISFGQNSFYIQLAIRNLIFLLLKDVFLYRSLDIDVDDFTRRGVDLVSRSVRINGSSYIKYPVNSDGHMQFGAHSIHVPTFVRLVSEPFGIRVPK